MGVGMGMGVGVGCFFRFSSADSSILVLGIR